MTNEKLKNREYLTTEEIDNMLNKADREIEDHYFRFRVKALICIFKKTGKRRSEVASLKRKDVKVEYNKIFFTFTIRKKHKKGFFQYTKWLKKNNPRDLEIKSFAELKDDHKDVWVNTKDGHTFKQERRTKSLSTLSGTGMQRWNIIKQKTYAMCKNG